MIKQPNYRIFFKPRNGYFKLNLRAKIITIKLHFNDLFVWHNLVEEKNKEHQLLRVSFNFSWCIVRTIDAQITHIDIFSCWCILPLLCLFPKPEKELTLFLLQVFTMQKSTDLIEFGWIVRRFFYRPSKS